VGEYEVPLAHSMATKFNGNLMQNINFEVVEFNVDVDDSLFTMPAAAEKTTEVTD
jgi:outer membrane lipoprotein-sorting protein